MPKANRDGAGRRFDALSRRERQCLDALFQRGGATVAEVMDAMPDPPGYSAVRATLNVLVDKGYATYKQDGPRYVYLPAMRADTARSAALRHLINTFFAGSAEDAVVALLEISDTKASRDALERLTRRVDAARTEGR